MSVLSSALPNITGTANWNQNGKDYDFSGAFQSSTYVSGANVGTGNSTGVWQLSFNAANSNSIYGNSKTVQPPALVLLPQIKY